MRGIYFNGREASYRADLVKPSPSETQSLIRVKYAGICNTDKEMLRGYRPDFHGVMGHEFVGEVVESKEKHLIGKLVVGELNAGCGTCIYCTTGREKHCESRKVLGIHGKDGCFAEYITLENHLVYEVPEGLSDQEALWAEPLAAAVQIANQVHLKPNESIAIVGDGRLSYQIASVLYLQGIALTIYGKHDEKLSQFAHMATKLVNITEESQEISMSYEVVVEVTGATSGIELATKLVRKAGTIIIKSTYAERVTLDLSYYVVNEITLIGSRCGQFPPALQLLDKKLIQLPEVKFYDLTEFQEAFQDRGFKIGFKL